MKKGTKKRSPEETQAAVDRAKELVKSGMSVAEALTQEKLQASSWYKYKNKRKPYEKKPMIVSEIEPTSVKIAGSRTMFIVTDDPEVIARMLEKLS